MRRRATEPGTEISVFATEISVTGLEIFPYEHSSPVTGMKPVIELKFPIWTVTGLKSQLSNRAEMSYINRRQTSSR